MRVVALVATYNERRFVAACIEHLQRHGVDVYLIDNESIDETREIAERYRGAGLIGAEVLPREGDVFSLRRQLRRKEEVARELEADWFIHLDADELRLPPAGRGTLADALRDADAEGYNAVDFLELSFLPTREHPGHDHAEFERTLRTYYPFLPQSPHRLNAWKATPGVDLGWKGGHRVRFPGLRMYPQPFLMKHYIFLSAQHAAEKYAQRSFPPQELAIGWHGWREGFSEGDVHLPNAAELRSAGSDQSLDPRNPSRYHYFDERWSGVAPPDAAGQESR